VKKAVLLLTCTLTMLVHGQLTHGQENIPVFTWRSHFSYQNVFDIAQSADRVYAASPNALFYVDKQELSIHKLTKIDGLSGVAIGAIGVAPGSNTLVIGYTNGNIDLLEANTITNIRGFIDATTIGGKVIRDIKFNQGLAYLSTDQGVLVLDLQLKQITESYQNLNNGERVGVLGLSFSSDSIYAASNRGIFSASLATSTNRQDFNNWNHALPTVPFSHIESNGTDLLAASFGEIYVYTNDKWELTHRLEGTVTDFDFTSQLLILTTDALYRVEANDVQKLQDLETDAQAIAPDGNSLWLGNSVNGLLRLSGGSEESFSPPGPISDLSWRMTFGQEAVTILQGGFSEEVTTLGRTGEYSTFGSNNSWEISLASLGVNNGLFDLVDMEIPTDENTPLYLASFDRGLVAITADEVAVVNEISPNSTLAVVNGSVNMTAIAKEGEGLWLTNYGATVPLHFWEPGTDTWTPYNLAISQADFAVDLYVAPNGDKWLTVDPERGGGIVVFNETSQTERYLNTNGGQGGLPGSQVTSLALDSDFFLWVGTNEGIAFYPNLNAILDGGALTASVPIFENRLLLRDEFITSIAIDPGNRKWFGTRNNGLWLFSETGEEQIRHFTADNSPLPSDQITNLAMNPQTGELFIGTDKGTVSFRSDATEGTNQHENVSIYPNPAMRNTLDQIVINGLVNNAQVKITDVSGKLVKEVRAQGSTALWNGRDYNGRTVSTGVYLVYSSNADGTETYVGKIAVI